MFYIWVNDPPDGLGAGPVVRWVDGLSFALTEAAPTAEVQLWERLDAPGPRRQGSPQPPPPSFFFEVVVRIIEILRWQMGIV